MSATVTTSRNVTRTRSVSETVPVRTAKAVTLRQNRSGSVDILIGGAVALRLTASGYLRRFPGMPTDLGFNLTGDGRIAIKLA